MGEVELDHPRAFAKQITAAADVENERVQAAHRAGA